MLIFYLRYFFMPVRTVHISTPAIQTPSVRKKDQCIPSIPARVITAISPMMIQ